jgi:hypothetical protein
VTTGATTKNFRTARQEVLFQQLASDMETYRKREQAQYLLNGMSTSHIVLHALKTPATLLEFGLAWSTKLSMQLISAPWLARSRRRRTRFAIPCCSWKSWVTWRRWATNTSVVGV